MVFECIFASHDEKGYFGKVMKSSSGSFDPFTRTREMLRADGNPIFFAESPYFLNLKLFPEQERVLREFYDTSKGYEELILVLGMRSGKTTLAAVIALYEVFQLLKYSDPAKHYGLVPGQDVFITCTAPSEEQALDTIFAQIEALACNSPFFQQEGAIYYKLEIKFPQKHVNILSGSSSSATLVGRSNKCVIFDELARFMETEGQRGAWKVYTSLSRSVKTFGQDGKVIAISSPLHENDIIMELYRRSGRLPKVLAKKFATWEFNPKVTRESLKDEEEKDPISFWRDFGAEPQIGVYPFFDPQLEKFDYGRSNVLELINQGYDVSDKVHNCVLACDPAVKGDSFGVAIGHREGQIVIINGTFRFKPTTRTEVSPVAVREFLDKVRERFNVPLAVFDTHMYPELMEHMRAKGTRIEKHVVGKEDYDRVKEMLYYKKLKIPYSEVLKMEFDQLQAVDARRVDHVKGGSKDVADCVANVVWVLEGMEQVRKSPVMCELTR